MTTKLKTHTSTGEYSNPFGYSAAHRTFNVIHQQVTIVRPTPGCDFHKASKSQWIRRSVKRRLNQSQWIVAITGQKKLTPNYKLMTFYTDEFFMH